MKSLFCIFSILFSFTTLAADRTVDGKACSKAMGPVVKTTYIGLIKKEGKTVTAMRSDQIMKMGGKEISNGSTVQFDDGKNLTIQAWNRGALLKPITNESAYPPNDIESLMNTMAPIIFGPCKDWKVDASKFRVPTFEEIKKAHDKSRGK